MKKFIALAAIAIFAGIGVAAAETSSVSDRFTSSESDFNESTNALGAINLKNNQLRYLKAIARRQREYFTDLARKEFLEDTGVRYNNTYGQRLRHNYGRASINVNSRSTKLESAEGEFTDYKDQFVRPYAARANSKQTFRARAICYYVEGGDANSDCMKNGLIDGQRHRVLPKNLRQEQAAVGAINLSARDQLKSAAKDKNTDLSKRVSTARRGGGYKHVWYRLPYLSSDQE